MRLFKKNKDDSSSNAEDSSRLGLFGSRGKNKSPAPPSDNPYAQPPSGNPYAQAPQGGNPYGGPQQDSNPYGGARSGAYAQAKANAYSGGSDPYASRQQGGSEPQENSNGQDNKGGYGANKYGALSGYGSDRYGSGDNKTPAASSRYGAGGYGGFAARDPYATQADDPNRNALFGGASERAQNKTASIVPPPYDSGSAAGDFRGEGNRYDPPGAYNPGPKYEDRQLTAEEEEEEHVQAQKQEIRQIKQKDVAATRNALRMAQQAEEVGRDTLARLGVQAEHIYNTEKNLDLAHNQNKQAEEKARELKTLNRSMFAVHVSNPFNAKSRDEARDASVRARHEEERAEREGTRRGQFLAHQRMEKNFNDLSQPQTQEQKQKNLAERSKYQFEADSEDEEMENEIDNNLNALSGVVKNMNRIAKATGTEVEEQNRRLQEVHKKSDKVDIGLASNSARLNLIK